MHSEVQTLIETGEWVAFAESFVLSEETKEKRRDGEGPAEQILIKVPEGPVTQAINKHLEAMQRAAQADALKLTSKAITGKRSLMVDGTKAAHERVKLMVKELTERGESPMLNKAIAVAKRAASLEREESAARSVMDAATSKAMMGARVRRMPCFFVSLICTGYWALSYCALGAVLPFLGDTCSSSFYQQRKTCCSVQFVFHLLFFARSQHF